MKAIPTDYEQLFHLSDIEKWNFYRVIKRIVEINSFYTCMYEDKKTLIIA